MKFLGENKLGEDVYGNAAGGRFVMKGDKVLSELSSPTGFEPHSPLSDDRFKTVPEIIEGICRQHEGDISGMGAVAAVREMTKYWPSHLAEGHPLSILVKDMQDMKAKTDNIIADLQVALDLPAAVS